MMVEQEMIEESNAKVMMADDEVMRTLSPNPESKIKEMKLDGCGKSNTVHMAGAEQDTQDMVQS
jgi:hypothetical protein